jgi:toxin secretion/phage lysis holin
VVAVANIIDVHIIKEGAILRTAALFLFISNEGISLMENAGNMGVPIPKKIVNVLKQLNQKSNKEENDEKN